MGDSYSINHNIKVKGSDEYAKSEDEIYFGVYFFLGNTLTDHQRDFFDIVDCVSRAGGIFATLLSFFGAIGRFVNTQTFMSELMTEM